VAQEQEKQTVLFYETKFKIFRQDFFLKIKWKKHWHGYTYTWGGYEKQTIYCVWACINILWQLHV